VSAPEPEQIYERTREEGRRRLSRPVLELAATALVGGFDVAFGIAVYGLTAAAVAPRAGTGLAHLSGSIGFGIAFVFIVVGRSELFTENFLVPITGLSRRRDSWLKLGELWAVSLVLNLAGGALLAVLLTSHGVLRPGSGESIVRLADQIAGYSPGTTFLSGVVAGALMTVLTWFVEGRPTRPESGS
jgi:formate/nitrite transporter FocA (FNT family)